MTRSSFAITLALALLALPLVAAEVPRPAPEFVIHLVNGQQLLLSQYKGKVVGLEFLNTTCPHCQDCSAIMNRVYKEFGPQGFQAIGVAFNDMATMLVPDYVKMLQLTFPVGVAPRGEVIDFLQFPMSQMMYVPQLIFVDRKGVIRAYYNGTDDFFKPDKEEANMRAIVEKLLKEPAPKASTAKPRHSTEKSVTQAKSK